MFLVSTGSEVMTIFVYKGFEQKSTLILLHSDENSVLGSGFTLIWVGFLGVRFEVGRRRGDLKFGT